jgi:hypothetical protein
MSAYSRICGWQCPECETIELHGWNTDDLPPICVNVGMHNVPAQPVIMRRMYFDEDDRRIMAEAVSVSNKLREYAHGT